MLFGAAVMETDRMIPSASQNGSPGSQQSGGSAGLQQPQGMVGAPPPLPPPMQSQQPPLPPTPLQQQQYLGSMTRKKKTERLVPPILDPQSLIDDATAAAAVTAAQNSYANHPAAAVYANGRPFYSGGVGGGIAEAPAGILVNSSASISGHTNHGYSQDNGIMSSVNIPAEDSTDERQEVIQVQILPQDDHWGETGTAVTVNSDLDFTMNGTVGAGAGIGDNDFGDGGAGNVDKSRLLGHTTDRSWAFRLRRHAGPLVSGILSVLAVASPIVMVALPNVGALHLRESDLVCGVECDGMIVSLAFKLVVLVLGTWAVFLRRPRATLPRIRIFRAVVSLLTVVFIVSFWLFYASHVAKRERAAYKTDHSFLQSLVQFAVNLTDSLIFVHYLAVLLMELRHTQAQYYVKVVRSPDGESKGFSIGDMSVQRAAEYVLDRYYSEFPIYNPYLDRIGSGGGTGSMRMRKGVKMYDVDGPGTNDGNSTVVSVASKGRSHGDRLIEELEFERKVKKRRARLIAATEDAFTHIKRMREDQPARESKPPMEPYEAAQAIFPTLSRSLQKYLRATRQQPRHTMESILQHLSTCLSYDLSPRAFLEKYLVAAPVLQNDREVREVQHWSLVSERSLYRDIQPGVAFQLRQGGDVSLLCQVERLPHFFLREEIIEPSSNRFVLRLNSETSV